jgi:hypothetical protein
MDFVPPTEKDTVNQYNEATSVVSARVTKVIKGEISADRARIKTARQEYYLASEKVDFLKEQIDDVTLDIKTSQSNLKADDKAFSEKTSLLLMINNTNKELLNSLKISLGISLKAFKNKIKALQRATDEVMDGGLVSIPINQFREDSFPINIVMQVVESYKGDIKKEDILSFNSEGISFADCGGPSFSNYQHKLKVGDMLTLYSHKKSVFEWNKFSNVEEQHRKVLSIKRGEYSDNIPHSSPPVFSRPRTVIQSPEVKVRVGKVNTPTF